MGPFKERLLREYVSRKELWLSLLAAGFITAIYALVISAGQLDDPSRALFRHLLGVLGFIIMLLTESVYAIRKTQPNATRENMRPWLQLHNFTGLVGPYLVLLHSSWKFHGLAGVTLLLTLTMVASGIVGRYIYTWVASRLEEVEMAKPAPGSRLAGLERARRVLGVWRVIHVTLGLSLFLCAFTHAGAELYYATLMR